MQEESVTPSAALEQSYRGRSAVADEQIVGSDYVTRFEHDERERRFEESIKSLKELLLTHIQSVKDMTAQSFQAARDAKIAADAALKEYKTQSNEIRGAMNDLSSHMMPRLESESHWTAAAERIESIKAKLQEKIDEDRKQLGTLNQAVSNWNGKQLGRDQTINLANWGIGLAVAIGLGLIATITQIITLVWKH